MTGIEFAGADVVDPISLWEGRRDAVFKVDFRNGVLVLRGNLAIREFVDGRPNYEF